MDVTEAVCRALNIFFGISGCEDSWCYPYVKLQGESICLKSKQPVSFERSAVVSAAKRIPDGSLPGGELEREVVLRIPVDESTGRFLGWRSLVEKSASKASRIVEATFVSLWAETHGVRQLPEDLLEESRWSLLLRARGLYASTPPEWMVDLIDDSEEASELRDALDSFSFQPLERLPMLVAYRAGLREALRAKGCLSSEALPAHLSFAAAPDIYSLRKRQDPSLKLRLFAFEANESDVCDALDCHHAIVGPNDMGLAETFLDLADGREDCLSSVWKKLPLVTLGGEGSEEEDCSSLEENPGEDVHADVLDIFRGGDRDVPISEPDTFCDRPIGSRRKVAASTLSVAEACKRLNTGAKISFKSIPIDNPRLAAESVRDAFKCSGLEDVFVAVTSGLEAGFHRTFTNHMS